MGYKTRLFYLGIFRLFSCYVALILRRRIRHKRRVKYGEKISTRKPISATFKLNKK
jgi:hypothetical protein